MRMMMMMNYHHEEKDEQSSTSDDCCCDDDTNGNVLSSTSEGNGTWNGDEPIDAAVGVYNPLLHIFPTPTTTGSTPINDDVVGTDHWTTTTTTMASTTMMVDDCCCCNHTNNNNVLSSVPPPLFTMISSDDALDTSMMDVVSRSTYLGGDDDDGTLNDDDNDDDDDDGSSGDNDADIAQYWGLDTTTTTSSSSSSFWMEETTSTVIATAIPSQSHGNTNNNNNFLDEALITSPPLPEWVHHSSSQLPTDMWTYISGEPPQLDDVDDHYEDDNDDNDDDSRMRMMMMMMMDTDIFSEDTHDNNIAGTEISDYSITTWNNNNDPLHHGERKLEEDETEEESDGGLQHLSRLCKNNKATIPTTTATTLVVDHGKMSTTYAERRAKLVASMRASQQSRMKCWQQPQPNDGPSSKVIPSAADNDDSDTEMSSLLLLRQQLAPHIPMNRRTQIQKVLTEIAHSTASVREQLSMEVHISGMHAPSTNGL